MLACCGVTGRPAPGPGQVVQATRQIADPHPLHGRERRDRQVPHNEQGPLPEEGDPAWLRVGLAKAYWTLYRSTGDHRLFAL